MQQASGSDQHKAAGAARPALDLNQSGYNCNLQTSHANSHAAGKRNRPMVAANAARPAVEVDQPGCSYNPDAEQHQDAVAAAVAAEVQKQLAAELAPKPPVGLAHGAAELDDLRMLQVLSRHFQAK